MEGVMEGRTMNLPRIKTKSKFVQKRNKQLKNSRVGGWEGQAMTVNNCPRPPLHVTWPKLTPRPQRGCVRSNISKTRASCFIGFSKHSKTIKALGLGPRAFISFLVFGNPDETLALVFEKTLSTYFIPLSQWKITLSEPAPATDDQVSIQL